MADVRQVASGRARRELALEFEVSHETVWISLEDSEPAVIEEMRHSDNWINRHVNLNSSKLAQPGHLLRMREADYWETHTCGPAACDACLDFGKRSRARKLACDGIRNELGGDVGPFTPVSRGNLTEDIVRYA